LTTALGAQVDLGAEAASASSQGFIASPLAGACRMLMGTDDGAVNKMEAPVQLASGIGLLLEACQDVLPDTRCLPAVEPAGNSLPRPISFGQIGPGRSSRQEPEEGIEDEAMIFVRAPNVRFLRRKEGRQPLPLRIS